MKTVRWVATELCKHSSSSPPPGKTKFKRNKKPKLQHAVKKDVKPQNKRALNRSSAPPCFVKSWLPCPFPEGSAALFAGGWRAAGLEPGAGWPWGEAAALPRPLSFRAPQLPPPFPASSPSLGSGWVLGKSCPLPSANLQGPGSMGTVRLVQNMCKMIFYKQS